MALDGIEYTTLAQISALPHMKKEDARKVLKHFSSMGVKNNNKIDVNKDRDRLRKLLMGKKK